MDTTPFRLVSWACLLAAACDGGGSGPSDAGGGFDFAVWGSDSSGPGGDTAGPGPDTGTTGPILCSEDLVLEPCQDSWCPQQATCFGDPAALDCVPACVAKARSDEEFLKRLLCAVATGGDFCAGWEVCLGTWAIPLDCVQLCDDLVSCDALGLLGFGTTKMDCRLACGGAWAAGGPAKTSMVCDAAALDTCSGTALLACGAEGDPCDAICAEPGAETCSLVPDAFPATDTCAGTCNAWVPGRKHATETCLTFGTAWGLPCPTTAASCAAVPPALPPGVPPYCESLTALCGDALTWAGLGGLGLELCGWNLLGQVSSSPGLFVSWEEATLCLEGLAACPESVYRPVYCLFHKPPETATLCAPLSALCAPADHATQAIQACEIYLVLSSVQGPDPFQAAQACLGAAADCTAKIACFQSIMDRE